MMDTWVLLWAHMCHKASEEGRGQLLGIASLPPPWIAGMRLKSSGLCDKCFDLLIHLTDPQLLFYFFF